jgi:ATP-dependent DNA ligase
MIPCYPLRPFSAGCADDFDSFIVPSLKAWAWEPKYNGWRVVVHAPTGTAFCRRGLRMSAEEEFREAMKTIKDVGDLLGCEWFDCEGLSRRHAQSKGSLLILDVMDLAGDYTTRRSYIEALVSVHSEIEKPLDPSTVAAPLSVLTTPGNTKPAHSLWERCKAANVGIRADYYEGLVGKCPASPYLPSARPHPEQDTKAWAKVRWPF